MPETREAPGTTPAATPAPEPAVAPPPAISPEEHQAALAENARLTAEVQRLQAEVETATTKRIPDLQRINAEKDREVAQARDEVRLVDAGWREWAKENDGKTIDFAEIEDRHRERTGQVLKTEAGQRERLEVIADLLASDDDADRTFGRWLRKQPKETVITKTNVEQHRAAFNEARGTAAPTPTPTTPPTPAPANGQPAASAAPAAAAAPKPPPVVPGAGAPTTTPEPAYRPGDTPQTMWGRVFRRG